MTARAPIIAGKAVIVVQVKDSVDKALKTIESRLKKFSYNFSKLGFELFGGGLLGSLGTIAATKEFTKFEDAILFLSTKLQATADEMKEVTDLIRELGRTTSFTATQVTEAATVLAQAGFAAKDVQNLLQPTLDLARSDMITLSQAGEILANTLRSYSLETSKANEVASQFIVASRLGTLNVIDLKESIKEVLGTVRSLNIDLPTTLALITQLAERSLKGTKAGTSLNTALLNLASKRAQLKELLNVDLPRDLNGDSFIKFLDELYMKLNRLGNLERTAILQQLFNIRGGRAITALDDLKKVSDLQKQIRAAGDEARISSKVMDSGFGGSIRRATSAAESLSITLGKVIAYGIKPLIDIMPQLTAALETASLSAPQLTLGLLAMPAILVGVGAALIATSVLATKLASVIGMLATAVGFLSAQGLKVLQANLIGVGLLLRGLTKAATKADQGLSALLLTPQKVKKGRNAGKIKPSSFFGRIGKAEISSYAIGIKLDSKAIARINKIAAINQRIAKRNTAVDRRRRNFDKSILNIQAKINQLHTQLNALPDFRQTGNLADRKKELDILKRMEIKEYQLWRIQKEQAKLVRWNSIQVPDINAINASIAVLSRVASVTTSTLKKLYSVLLLIQKPFKALNNVYVRHLAKQRAVQRGYLALAKIGQRPIIATKTLADFPKLNAMLTTRAAPSNLAKINRLLAITNARIARVSNWNPDINAINASAVNRKILQQQTLGSLTARRASLLKQRQIELDVQNKTSAKIAALARKRQKYQTVLTAQAIKKQAISDGKYGTKRMNAELKLERKKNLKVNNLNLMSRLSSFGKTSFTGFFKMLGSGLGRGSMSLLRLLPRLFGRSVTSIFRLIKGFWTLTRGLFHVANAARRFIFSFNGITLILELLLMFGHKIPFIKAGMDRLAEGFKQFGARIKEIGAFTKDARALFGVGFQKLFSGDMKIGFSLILQSIGLIIDAVKNRLSAAFRELYLAISPALDYMYKMVTSIHEVFSLLANMIGITIKNLGTGIDASVASATGQDAPTSNLAGAVKEALSPESIQAALSFVAILIKEITVRINAILEKMFKVLISIGSMIQNAINGFFTFLAETTRSIADMLPENSRIFGNLTGLLDTLYSTSAALFPKPITTDFDKLVADITASFAQSNMEIENSLTTFLNNLEQIIKKNFIDDAKKSVDSAAQAGAAILSKASEALRRSKFADSSNVFYQLGQRMAMLPYDLTKLLKEFLAPKTRGLPDPTIMKNIFQQMIANLNPTELYAAQIKATQDMLREDKKLINKQLNRESILQSNIKNNLKQEDIAEKFAKNLSNGPLKDGLLAGVEERRKQLRQELFQSAVRKTNLLQSRKAIDAQMQANKLLLTNLGRDGFMPQIPAMSLRDITSAVVGSYDQTRRNLLKVSGAVSKEDQQLGLLSDIAQNTDGTDAKLQTLIQNGGVFL